MATATPEVRIRSSRLIYGAISKPFFEKDNPDKEMMPPEQVQEIVETYKEAWGPKEKVIIKGMTSLFQLEFYKDVLDVYCAPWVPTFSTPTIVSVKFEPDRFIDILAHELLHVLVSDNSSYSFEQYTNACDSLWPREELLVKNHILVHAGLEYIFRDVLGEEYRLERDIENSQKNPPYARAWSIVSDTEYLKVLDDFRRAMEETKA